MTRPVLLLEFTGVDSEAGIAESLPPGLADEVSTVDPLDVHFEREVSLAEQADEIASAHRGALRLVLGVCSGAALAAHLASRLNPQGPPPRLVLVNPYLVTPSRLSDEFAKLYGNLHGDPATAVTGFEDALMSRRDWLVQASGGPVAADLADYLLRRYLAWLRFLSACVRAPQAPQVGPISVLTDAAASNLDSIVSGPDIDIEVCPPQRLAERLRSILES